MENLNQSIKEKVQVSGLVFDGTTQFHSLAEGLPVISDDNYYDDRRYVTNSMLTKLNQSPNKLADYLKGIKDYSDAFVIGDAVHKGILEPHKLKMAVWNNSMLPSPDQTMRANVNKEWFKKFQADNTDSIILHEKDYNDVMGMIDSINRREEVMQDIRGARYETIALKWVNGIPCKAKADIIKGSTIIDIKTTNNIELNDFKHSCIDYGYFRQAAFYLNMFNADKFKFIVVEKNAPYRVAVYEMSLESINRGWNEIVSLLETYKYYFVDDIFGEKLSVNIIKGTL